MLIPILNKAISAAPPPPPPPPLQFVTVGSVPRIRNHTMAAVAPLRRLVKRTPRKGR